MTTTDSSLELSDRIKKAQHITDIIFEKMKGMDRIEVRKIQELLIDLRIALQDYPVIER